MRTFSFTSRRHTPSHAGFTLVELMVSISIFSIVVLISVSTLLVLIDANRRAQGLKSSMNNTFFAMESVTRLIRTGHNYHCRSNTASQSATIVAQDCTSGNTHLYLLDDTGRRVGVYYDSANRRVMQDIDGTVLPLTSSDIEVTSFRFFVTGAQASTPDAQPIVTLRLIGTANPGTRLETSIQLQTTVTERALDLP